MSIDVFLLKLSSFLTGNLTCGTCANIFLVKKKTTVKLYGIQLYSIQLYSIKLYSIQLYSIQLYIIHLYSIQYCTVCTLCTNCTDETGVQDLSKPYSRVPCEIEVINFICYRDKEQVRKH